MADNPSMKWYVVHTYSGYENKVKANLDKNVENNGLQDMIGAVEIPVEEVLEIRNGKSHVVQRKRMPGYVLVRMVMTNESWYIVRNTRGVTGFVGAGNKPSPLSDEEYNEIMAAIPVTRLDVQVGDEVRILNGIFENFTGKVTHIDTALKRVTVVVEMLNRATNVDLELDEVVRVDI
ncbi:MAG: transcription termination/antitermination factor NusG [Clostridia bacterium]|jgi:transcriptional antiterminator NusG|nr:transcription termination/antitermination factor NusG [Clostridia bacterium]MBR5985485.1 transcription termination/antitermination factor NusG [Clostridia bacterium]MBR6009284.1 transcription termination/antitermination factor NusG [Clostridia bacterium]